ncbi:MAG: beta-ketoacyl synthase N-terminal-like domain-containing protein, partial [Rhodothermales bacterium]|nr:beta-ketoacyl synthase N-terminal-like domain-containing protein [Rhodothermales bacterium]
MRDVYIVSAVRSPIGKFGGALKDHSPVDLAAPVMKAALERAGAEGEQLDLVMFGNVLRAGQGQLVPRQAALKAGIPKEVDAMAIDMVCSSGMMSVMNAATTIKAGEADLILAGGTESMSGAGFYLSSGARWGYKYLAGAFENVTDVMFRDGLSDPMSGEAMGDQTERLAEERGITREALDEVAEASNRRAAEATDGGAFADEIVPMEYRARRETRTLER